MNLVFHQGALGDFVVTLPTIRALGPGSMVVAPASKARLASQLVPGVQGSDIEQARWSRLHAPEADVELPPAKRVISFVSDGADAWAANVRRLLPDSQLAFVQPRPPVHWTDHVTTWQRQQLREQGVDLAPVDVPQRHNPGGPIVIHPGSGGAPKCWPVERYVALAEQLRHRAPVHVIVGEVEAETWPGEALASLNARVLDSLDQLGDTLVQASLYIGNDSGPTHLAAQLGVPTIAIFGPTPPSVWRPIGPQVHVVAPPASASIRDVAFEDVLAACLRVS